MNIQIAKFLTLLLFTSVCANAQEKRQSTPSNIGKTSLIYYDGKNQLTIFRLEGLVAELNGGSGKNSSLKKLDSSAIAVNGMGNVQIFRVKDQNLIHGGKVSSKAKQTGNFSAVYSRSGDENQWILPVGLIVSYKLSTNDTQISELESKYSLKKGSKLPISNLKYYSYETEPGQDSLDLAALIRLESIVDSTSVDFIEEKTTR